MSYLRALRTQPLDTRGGGVFSGKGRALLPFPPLRTVRATFTAHGSSKLLTARPFLAHAAALPPGRRLLLMTVQVYQHAVGPRLRTTLATCGLVVPL